MNSIHQTTTVDQLLTAKLYNTSVNPTIKKRRLFAWLMIPILYSVLAFIFWSIKGGNIIYYFIIFIVLWIIFYPFWESRRFKNSYLKGLEKNQYNLLQQSQEIIFDNDIHIKTGEKSETYTYQDLVSVVEIEKYHLLVFKNERTIAVNKENLTPSIENLLKEKNISFLQKLNWKWR